MEEDGKTLFCEQKGIVIGREYVQKDENWKPRDYGSLSMTEDEIRDRLLSDGYKAACWSTPEAPAKIKAAAATKNPRRLDDAAPRHPGRIPHRRKARPWSSAFRP